MKVHEEMKVKKKISLPGSAEFHFTFIYFVSSIYLRKLLEEKVAWRPAHMDQLSRLKEANLVPFIAGPIIMFMSISVIGYHIDA